MVSSGPLWPIFYHCKSQSKPLSMLDLALFLKVLTEGAVSTETGRLLQYLTTLTPKNLLHWWLRRVRGRKNEFGSTPSLPENISNATIRLARTRHYAGYVYPAAEASLHRDRKKASYLRIVEIRHEVWRTGLRAMFEVWTHQCPIYWNESQFRKTFEGALYLSS